jgi:predicted molibdopterin-dependent oxidoreductase YjgC
VKQISVKVNNKSIVVPEGSTVATAVYMAGETAFRKSVTGQLRSPVCGMGICFECRVQIDNQPHQRACHQLCREGMEIRTL